jgi:hypothetical protein
MSDFAGAPAADLFAAYRRWAARCTPLRAR